MFQVKQNKQNHTRMFGNKCHWMLGTYPSPWIGNTVIGNTWRFSSAEARFIAKWQMGNTLWIGNTQRHLVVGIC